MRCGAIIHSRSPTHGNRLIVLLCGGDKSAQAKDIQRAKRSFSENGNATLKTTITVMKALGIIPAVRNYDP